jgi:hypothetical protein
MVGRAGVERPGTVREVFMFKSNVGSVDRMLRIILGIGLLAMVFVGPQTPWGWFGLVPLITGLLTTCPVYSLLGWNSGAR